MWSISWKENVLDVIFQACIKNTSWYMWGKIISDKNLCAVFLLDKAKQFDKTSL